MRIYANDLSHADLEVLGDNFRHTLRQTARRNAAWCEEHTPIFGIPCRGLGGELRRAVEEALLAIRRKRPGVEWERLTDRVRQIRATTRFESRRLWGCWRPVEGVVALRRTVRCHTFAVSLALHEFGHALDEGRSGQTFRESEAFAEGYVRSVGYWDTDRIMLDRRACGCGWCVRHFGRLWPRPAGAPFSATPAAASPAAASPAGAAGAAGGGLAFSAPAPVG